MRTALCFFLALAFCGGAALLAPLRSHADLQVNQRVDKVVLKDGTVIECIVLMVTAKSVLVVETDKTKTDDKASKDDKPAKGEDDKDKEKEKDVKTHQRIIPFEDVERIEYGKSDGSTAGFQTDGELAHKVIQGTGYRKEETKKDKEKRLADEQEKKKTPSANQPLDMSKVKTIGTEKLAAANTKLSAKELSDAYMSRFPLLKDTAQQLIGLDRVPQLLDAAQKGDPQARTQVEGFLGLFLGTDTSSLAEKEEPEGSQKPTKPSKPSRVPPPAKKPAPATGAGQPPK